MVDLDVQNIISKPPVIAKTPKRKRNVKKKIWQCKIYNYLEVL